MNTKDINLFPQSSSKRKSVALTKKEAELLRIAHAYGISRIAAAKLIVLLRKQQKAANTATRKSRI